jgi:hypothetical protein
MSESNIGLFPSELDPPEVKLQESWGLRYSQAIVSSSERSDETYTDRKDRWEENRRYGRGLQDIDKLKPKAIPTENEWATLPYDIGTPVPKQIRVIQETIYSHPYKPKVEVFDSHSHSRLERRKNELLAKMQLSKEVANMKAEGILPEQLSFQKLDGAPKDAHEVEMYLKTNAKTIEEIAIEKLVRRSFARCNMPAIEKRFVRDAAEIQWMASYTGIDDNGNFYAEYIDPMLSGSSYVENEDFSDMTWAYHVSYITVGEFRDKMPHLNDDQVLSVIRQNVGNRLKDDYNLELGTRNYFNLSPDERNALDSVLIEVLNFETLQSDRVTYVEKKLSTGGFDIKKRSADYEGPKDPDSKKKTHKGIIERIYKGCFIMKTQYMLKWGLKEGVAYKVRKGKMIHKPLFGYVFYAPGILNMVNKSLVEEVRPHIDTMGILQLKMLHFIALADPPGHAIDITSVVEAIKGMGMEGLKPKDIAEMKSWTGNYYYASRDEMGNAIVQPGMKPIEFQPSTLDQAVERFAMLYNNELQKVKEILGVNDAVDGSTPDKKALVGVQNQAIAAHKTSVRYLQQAYLHMVQEIAQRCAYYQQLAIKEGTISDEMKDLLSEPEFAVLDAKKIGELMYNIKMELLPDAQQQGELREQLNIALQQGMISVDDVIMIQRVAKESLEKAEEIFQMRVERKRVQQQEASQQQMQAEQQSAMQIIQAEAQRDMQINAAKMEMENAKGEIELAAIREKGIEERMSMTEEYDRKEKLAEKQAELEAQYGDTKSESKNTPATPR